MSTCSWRQSLFAIKTGALAWTCERLDAARRSYLSDALWCAAPQIGCCLALARNQRRAAWSWWLAGWQISLWCTFNSVWWALESWTPYYGTDAVHARPLWLVVGMSMLLGVACGEAPLAFYLCQGGLPRRVPWTRGDAWLLLSVLVCTFNVVGLGCLLCVFF